MIQAAAVLAVVGLIAFFADLILWSSWGPGYARRRYVGQGPGPGYGYGYGASRWGYGRRRVIEEEEGGPGHSRCGSARKRQGVIGRSGDQPRSSLLPRSWA